MSNIARKYLPIYVTEDVRGLTLQGVPNKQNNLCSPATRDQQSFCWIEFPMSTLLCWETIHQHSNRFESCVRPLNMVIPGSGFTIRGDCERIDQRLKSKCYSALREFHSLMGRKQQEFACQKSFKMNVFGDEVISLDDLFDDFCRSSNEKEHFKEEVKKIYLELEEEIKKGENWRRKTS